MQKVSKLNQLLMYTLTFLIGAFATLGIMEIGLRFTPVADSLYAQPVNQLSPYKRFRENREIVYSDGWDFEIVSRKRVNNAGFLSDIDYIKQDKLVLAIIGDSYVEALQVTNQESVQGQLNEMFAGFGIVYAFGASGAPLSQYLGYAELVKTEYQPEAIAFVIVGNDFDESLAENKAYPGFHYFFKNKLTDGSADLEWKLVPFDGISFLGRLSLSSSLWRYMTMTAGVRPGDLFNLLTQSAEGQADLIKQYVGNVAAAATEKRVSDSKKAVQAFFRLLPSKSGLQPQQILFVLDGIRPHLYNSKDMLKAKGSYFDIMRDYFIEIATSGGYEVIDMQPAFENQYKQSGKRFEFPHNNHWNALAHSLVAQQINKSTAFRKFGRNINYKSIQ